MITIILVLAASVLVWIFRNQINLPINPTINQMSGKITEIKDNSVTVEGLVGTTNKQNKTVIFVTGNQTVFKNKVVTITEAEIKSGKPFKPQVQDKAGKFSDLQVGMNLFLIKSIENLFSVSQATAVEIDYATYVH